MSVRLPSGHRAELDLFAPVDAQPAWVECKSGDNYPGQLAQLASVLGRAAVSGVC